MPQAARGLSDTLARLALVANEQTRRAWVDPTYLCCTRTTDPRIKRLAYAQTIFVSGFNLACSELKKGQKTG